MADAKLPGVWDAVMTGSKLPHVWVICRDGKPVGVSEKAPTLVADYAVSAHRYVPAESAKAEAQPAGTGWVSVEERFPEPRTQVLFAVEAEVVCVGFWPGSGAAEWVDLECDRQGHNFCHEASDVTHWMPLPPPPEPRE